MQIKIEKIEYCYPGGAQALNGVSFSVDQGEHIGLVGENGSGKSTLARHLNGLLKPDSGSVMVGDWDTREHSPAQLANRVAYVFQNPDEQLFCNNVWDEVAFGPRQLHFPENEVVRAVNDSLELTCLTEKGGEHPHDLGFSKRKMVTVASALAMKSQIIVFDEPTTGMDTQEISIFSGVLQTLRMKQKTCIIITHDMDFLIENVERLIILKNGKKMMDGNTGNIFSRVQKTIASGILIPQIHQLSKALDLSPLPRNPIEFVELIDKRDR